MVEVNGADFVPERAEDVMETARVGPARHQRDHRLARLEQRVLVDMAGNPSLKLVDLH